MRCRGCAHTPRRQRARSLHACFSRRPFALLIRPPARSPQPNDAPLLASLDALESRVRDLQDVRPETGSFFVRLFLGKVNVKVASKKDREVLRDEYNPFKDRTNLGA